jgi:hypothetical protein
MVLNHHQNEVNEGVVLIVILVVVVDEVGVVIVEVEEVVMVVKESVIEIEIEEKVVVIVAGQEDKMGNIHIDIPWIVVVLLRLILMNDFLLCMDVAVVEAGHSRE